MKIKMKCIKQYNIIFLLLVMLIPRGSFASNGICAHSNEENAINTKALQSELMVAALSCNMQNQYNSFIQRFRSQISSHEELVKSYFSRIYKKNSDSRLNNFITHLANESSKRSLIVSSQQFCKQSSYLFNTLLTMPEQNISQISSEKQFVSLHNVPKCREQ